MADFWLAHAHNDEINDDFEWTWPSDIQSAIVEAYGGGGAGGIAGIGTASAGGGGGAYAEDRVPRRKPIAFVVIGDGGTAGSDGGPSYFAQDTQVDVLAAGGKHGHAFVGGRGGDDRESVVGAGNLGNSGHINNGGRGGGVNAIAGPHGGGGGGASDGTQQGYLGTNFNDLNGRSNNEIFGGAGGQPLVESYGAAGGNGGNAGSPGVSGTTPGGGGGGAGVGGVLAGNGGKGRINIKWYAWEPPRQPIT